MKLLMHVCCAPCAIESIAALREEGIEPALFWFNPNIHPYVEYRLRRDALKDYAASAGTTLYMEDEYGLRAFTRAVSPDFTFGERCRICYAMRMERTAAFAAEHGFDTITTTLLYSPYQDRDDILRIGDAAAKSHGVSFLPCDFRDRFRAGQEKAHAMEMYVQKYCGCIFSEEERFSSKARKALLREQKAKRERDAMVKPE